MQEATLATDRRLRALIEALLATHEPAIRRAFLEAMQDARSAVVLRDVVDALARGDVAGAMRAIEYSRAFLAPLDLATQAAYYDAGREFTRSLVADGRRNGVTVEIRFDPGNPRAAQWLREHSSTLVTEVIADQRTAIREALDAGMTAGRNPRTVALDVVGRVDRLAKKRVGGVIGLTSAQARWVENARQELLAGDPAYFKRKARDRRFDRTVAKAIREGRGVAPADVTRIASRYSDGLLKQRGETIARTESLTALSYGQDESLAQLMEASGLRADQVVKRWNSAHDSRTRDTHLAMDGQKVRADGVFTSPLGARLRFPRDSELGAPASETIACRCWVSHAVRWKGASDGLRP